MKPMSARGILQAIYEVGFVEGKNNVRSKEGFVVNDAIPDLYSLFEEGISKLKKTGCNNSEPKEGSNC